MTDENPQNQFILHRLVTASLGHLLSGYAGVLAAMLIDPHPHNRIDFAHGYALAFAAASETKLFAGTLANARSGGYTLQYTYHLTGGIKSITDPHTGQGWHVEYVSDKVGRTTAIGDATGFGPQTSFASGILYRAFGGVKAMTYSTTLATSVSVAYDTRLRPVTYEADSSANTSDIQNKTYSYTNDGSVKQATNAVDGDYSQDYEYDFAGRLKKNNVGGLGTGTPGTRYKQTLGYDAFSNLTSRATWDEATYRAFTAGYTNNRKTSGGYQNGTDAFDAAGNVVANTVSTLDQRGWKFDAVGRFADWVETSAYGGTTRWDQGETLTFDGDGRTTKRLKRSRMYASPPSGWYEEPEYYVYSSVTGQKIIELDQTGQWTKTNVYMGSTVIAEHTSGGVAFKHTDPVTGSTMQTNSAGEIEPYDVGRVEVEPLGAVLATQPPEVQAPHNFGKGGSVSNPQYGCVDELSQVPMPCALYAALMNHLDRVNGALGSGYGRHESTTAPLPHDFIGADNQPMGPGDPSLGTGPHGLRTRFSQDDGWIWFAEFGGENRKLTETEIAMYKKELADIMTPECATFLSHFFRNLAQQRDDLAFGSVNAMAIFQLFDDVASNQGYEGFGFSYKTMGPQGRAGRMPPNGKHDGRSMVDFNASPRYMDFALPSGYRVSTLIHELVHIAAKNTGLEHKEMYELAYQSAMDTNPSLKINKESNPSDSVASIGFNEVVSFFCKGKLDPPRAPGKNRRRR